MLFDNTHANAPHTHYTPKPHKDYRIIFIEINATPFEEIAGRASINENYEEYSGNEYLVRLRFRAVDNVENPDTIVSGEYLLVLDEQEAKELGLKIASASRNCPTVGRLSELAFEASDPKPYVPSCTGTPSCYYEEDAPDMFDDEDDDYNNDHNYYGDNRHDEYEIEEP